MYVCVWGGGGWGAGGGGEGGEAVNLPYLIILGNLAIFFLVLLRD